MKLQKRLAAKYFKCSAKRVKFDTEQLAEIKEAITMHDIRGLAKQGAITEKPANVTSRFSARKIKTQKAKGRRSSHGSRKGSHTARKPRKATWVAGVRNQREIVKLLRDKKMITIPVYHDLYMKVKGGFFRSRRHIKVYLTEKGILK
jgi:large subunit ribosomal protein L19e